MLKVIKQAGSFILSVVLLSGFFFMASTKNAHAYIDLGSAGLMVQMAIASAFGALFALKVYWRTFVVKFYQMISKIRGTSSRG